MVNSSTVAGIIVVAVVGITVLVLVLSVIAPQPEEPITPQPEEPKFDIEEKISILNEDRPDWAKFSLYEADWEESKGRFEANGITFAEVEDWNEFKENLIQSTLIISVDEESRVIWYGKYHVVYMYY